MSKTLSPKSSGYSYEKLCHGIEHLLSEARRQAARSVNTILTATYWEIGRRIVVFQQNGKGRARYGDSLLKQLSLDLTAQLGKGFSERNLEQMRLFYLKWPKSQTTSAISHMEDYPSQSNPFPLSWSHYVRLLSLRGEDSRSFYETEALQGGWSVRQLDRQIQSQFYERTALSKNKALMLIKGSKARPEDDLTPEQEIKDPYLLEFLGLKDEYSEAELEERLVHHLESFLLELGGDFAFVGRQKRIRIDNEWFRVDLVFYHRKLRSLILIDLKLGRMNHSHVGQMNLYLNYARQNWIHADENPPVGLILCADKDGEMARYSLDGLQNKVLVSEYKTVLPTEKQLVAEMKRSRMGLRRKVSSASKSALRHRVSKS